jgi:hypothetical protein
LVDFDGDGRTDILSGSYHPGDLYFFRRQTDGTFAAGETIKDRDGKDVNVGSAAHLFAVDWDHDGDLDLLVGNIQGEVSLVPNEGSRQKPAFGQREKLRAGDAEISAGHGDSAPVAADWDGDGKLDLIVGAGDGSVTLYRNIGTAAAPQLAGGELLLQPAVTENGQTKPGGPGMRTKVCVTDWNRDGRLDLLVGDFSMEAKPPPKLTDEQRKEQEEARKQLTEASRRYQERIEKSGYRKLAEEQQRLTSHAGAETDEDKRRREARLAELANEMETILKSLETHVKEYQTVVTSLRERLPNPEYGYHGWVWLFVQQAPSSE